MCCCKYPHKQTSCPSRQALSDGERVRLMRRFVGEGRASIPTQMLPTCGFRSQELTACAHGSVNISYVSRICSHRVCGALSILILQYYNVIVYYKVIPLIFKTYSDNNGTETKNYKGDNWNYPICFLCLDFGKTYWPHFLQCCPSIK